MSTAKRRVLLTGATGFIGSHLATALKASDWDVRATTRNKERAQSDGWHYLDVEKPETLEPALSGCDAAVYLIHSIDESDDYPEREANSAIAFREAAERAGVGRIVYLGGVEPAAKPSRHLQSRIRTGELLRNGKTSTIELRCGLVIGAGGSSRVIVRDLAARLPAMLLPTWLSNVSWPVWVGDVCIAISRSLEMDTDQSACFDLPGSERISHEELLQRVAKHLGKRPALMHVPVLSPRLSSYWIALVTRADLALARELVEGLKSDLEPTQPIYWDQDPKSEPTKLDDAIEQALSDAEVEAPSQAREVDTSSTSSKILTSLACIAPFCIAMALRDVVNIWLSTSTAAAISIPLAVAEIQRSRSDWHKAPDLARAAFGLAMGVLMSVATWLLYPVATALLPELETKVGWLYEMLRQYPGPQKAMLLMFAVVIAEELVWRGIIMDWLLPRYGPLKAIVFSSLLYVLPQVAFRSLTLVAVAFACGFVWSSMRATTRSVWPPLLAHLLWDILVFIVYPLA